MIYKVVIIDGFIANKRKTNIDSEKIRDVRVLKRMSERTFVALINSNYVLMIAKLLIVGKN